MEDIGNFVVMGVKGSKPMYYLCGKHNWSAHTFEIINLIGIEKHSTNTADHVKVLKYLQLILDW